MQGTYPTQGQSGRFAGRSDTFLLRTEGWTRVFLGVGRSLQGNHPSTLSLKNNHLTPIFQVCARFHSSPPPFPSYWSKPLPFLARFLPGLPASALLFLLLYNLLNTLSSFHFPYWKYAKCNVYCFFHERQPLPYQWHNPCGCSWVSWGRKALPRSPLPRSPWALSVYLCVSLLGLL